jgi:hypothetical protein|tara:strand:+ start:400 stop:690 length:291 start_codon:yes stop_codon:yes gene_type:complete
MNRQDTQAKDFQIKFGNLTTQMAFDYNYSMNNNSIKLKVPIKKDGVVFSTLSNLDLIVKIKDITTMEIESIFIDRESVYELIKEVQGRQGFPAQLG